MNKKLKEKWIKALKSKEYKQTKGSLSDDIGHCCLGVLCEVAGLKKDGRSYVYEDDIRSAFLPRPFREKIHLDVKTEEVLVEMNDNGKTFKQIANWIDKNIGPKIEKEKVSV